MAEFQCAKSSIYTIDLVESLRHTRKTTQANHIKYLTNAICQENFRQDQVLWIKFLVELKQLSNNLLINFINQVFLYMINLVIKLLYLNILFIRFSAICTDNIAHRISVRTLILDQLELYLFTNR